MDPGFFVKNLAKVILLAISGKLGVICRIFQPLG